eukprot:126729-Rhodomonas_salina.4
MQIHAYTHLTVGARSASVCLDCAAYNADCNLPCVRGLQARHPSERRLSYQHFLEAVQLLSQKKQVHMEVCDRCGITCKEKGALVARLESAPGTPRYLLRARSTMSSTDGAPVVLPCAVLTGGGTAMRGPGTAARGTDWRGLYWQGLQLSSRAQPPPPPPRSASPRSSRS